MRAGRLEQVASPGELYSAPASVFVAEFVGTMNRVPADYLGPGGVRVLGTVVPVSGEAPAAAGPVDALVRPESLTAEPDAGGNAVVTGRTFLGSLTRVTVRLPGEVEVKVDKPSTAAAALDPGTTVQVALAGTAPVLVDWQR
jgi:putative spermidine/putrescine transport system ATP-binding protein